MGLKVWLRRLVKALLYGFLGFLAISALTVAALRWVNPPTSSFMVADRIAGWVEGRERPWVYQEWVPWSAIPSSVPLAVVAAEDQRFPEHGGFDLVEIGNAWDRFRAGGQLRGASTISQQVAKNLFLWSGKSLLRKGLEAWFTLLIELTWPKRRILEVYLNIAQLGPHTYGAEAASWRYFDRPATALTERQAALMAAVLPNPERYRLEAPSAYVQKRAAWVRRQMRQLGMHYLDGL
jgi:monofunctional biosynthetic peptidoglycan transglycosylase